MSLTPAMIDALVAAGGTIEQLAAMVKADIAEQELRRADKRAGNAERQRIFKAKRRGNRSNTLPSVTPPIEEIIPPVSSNDETRRAGAQTPAKPKRIEAVACPPGVRPKVWQDFTRLRAKKGGVSETALEGIEREAVKAGWTLDAALAEIVARNWQGFKADWVDKQPVNGRSAPPGDYLETMLQKQGEPAQQGA